MASRCAFCKRDTRVSRRNHRISSFDAGYNLYQIDYAMRSDRVKVTGETMAKTPGNFEQPKPITKAEREARKAFRQEDNKAAISEHETAEKAFSDNRERLREERLAREALDGPMLYPGPELPDDTPIEKVRFSTRVRKAVSAAGWKTVGEIREASDADLLSLQDLGKGSVSYLRETLGLPSTDGVRPGENRDKR